MREEDYAKKEVLIIDDNRSSGKLEDFLKNKGYCPYLVDDVDEGLAYLHKFESLEVVLLSAALSARSGLDALRRIKDRHPNVIVIVIRAGMLTLIRAYSQGAFEVLFSPMNMEELCDALDQAFDRLYRLSNISLISEGKKDEEDSPLIGKSKLMRELKKQIGRAVSFKVSVLLTGENGTGKGVIARLMHTISDRRKAPFVTINCGAVPESLREDALFGHEKGAFTDAIDKHSGAFEQADGGTLFLDEVSNMTPALQGTLLNVLQEREFQRVGGVRTRSVDVRVISATNQNLEEMIEEGDFRMDLYYRLCDYEISVPPLRDRIEDIELLATHFLKRIEKENEISTIALSTEATELLKTYSWPGNVRELYSCLKRAAMNSQGSVILPSDIPSEFQMVSEDESSKQGMPGTRSAETPKTPKYQNLLDLPVVVFCQFISDSAADVTDKQIALWWKEFSNDGLNRAYMARRKIENWLEEYYDTDELDFPRLTEEYIKDVIDKSISQLSKFRSRIDLDSEPTEEAEPVCIIGKTLQVSLTEVLLEILKEYGGNKEKAAKELRTSLETLNRELSYRTADDEDDTNREDEDSKPTLRQIERFPMDEIMRLHTEPIKHFIWENLSRAEWRNKGLEGQARTVHLALKVLSKRLAGKHGYIYFGGLTRSRIEWNIYRRTSYLYANHAEVAKVLDKVERTVEKFWDKKKPFPSHHTLFTG